MDRQSAHDRIASLCAASLVGISCILFFLFPDIDQLGISALNLALCGLALWSGTVRLDDQKARSWEQIEISTWLVTSPWLLGFSHVLVTSLIAIACGVSIFAFAAPAVVRAELPARLHRRR